ncbi:hypothetical protein, variant [Aphanomyces invadans]|uniref:Uncharacterized protein n=1 Tax=Aphanomyces invadans TaxID=157072 RepID=A0A024UN08_9STRA|nr:hypothetical protein, variant [Aphanomyces invadans]ETW07242.1 hypothetical protein, variant [Aphanomyces invadans]|eukprot:XP_008863335.1 hypothetical protein, variant [Aphanomyces invadans]
MRVLRITIVENAIIKLSLVRPTTFDNIMAFVPPTLQPEHGYVLLIPVLMAIVHIWAGFKVGAARSKYGIHYPQMYAETSDANFRAFNCVQRAHQNVIENLAIFFALLVSSSYVCTSPTISFG